MLSWFSRRTPAAAPRAPVHNAQKSDEPIEAVVGRVAFNDGQREWIETFDCAALLVETLRQKGRSARVEDKCVIEDDTELCLRPVLLEFKPIHGQGVQTCTKVYVSHPTAIPKAVFEFQHSTGESMAKSIQAGYDAWSNTDLVALSDAIRSDPEHCTVLAIDSPARDGRPAKKRRVILGPVAHLQQHPSPAGDKHPFCPCCLLANSMATFKPLIDSDGLFAVRFFAMRGADGEVSADCRVNGDEFEAGKDALCQYVSTWPPAGFEFRKQYVIVQDAP